KIQDARGMYFFEEPLAPAGQLAFLFPGEGSQYVNMCADLCIHFPEVRQVFDLMEKVWAEQNQESPPSRFLFPAPSSAGEARAAGGEQLWQMVGATSLILAADSALLTVLRRLRIEPDAVVGHSTGEIPALLAAGIIDLPDNARMGQFAAELHR